MKRAKASDWLEQISRAKSVKDEWKKTFRIEACYDYWEGRQKPADVSDTEWITINLIYSSMLAELPALYSTDPYFYVSLAKSYDPDPQQVAEFEYRGKVRQSLLNYLKRELDLKSKARLSIFDAFFQFGVMKIHLSTDLEENPDYGSPFTDDFDNPVLDDNNEPLMQPEFLPANEKFKLTRIHPSDFLVDENAGPLDDDITWRAQRIRMPLEDVREDKRYTSKGRKAVQATEVSDASEKARLRRKKGQINSWGMDSSTPDTVVLWEVYCRKHKQMLVVAEGCEEFLLEPQEIPDGIEGDPFVTLRWTLRDDSWYPLPPVSQWLDPQREYCLIRSKILTHRKRYNRKYEVYEPAFDDPERAKSDLATGEDGTIIGKMQPVQAVWPISDAPLDMQVHTELAYVRQDFQDLAVGANQRGSGAGVDSATEAGILERRSEVREGDRVGLVSDFMVNIARKLDQLVQVGITEDQVIKISGPVPENNQWQQLRAADFESVNGEYEYTIDVGATTPRLPEIERSQLLAMLSLIAQNPQLALSEPLLKRLFELHHITDQTIIQEVRSIAEKIMSGQMMMPGAGGSQPGIPDMNPATGIGAAAGINNIRGGAGGQ